MVSELLAFLMEFLTRTSVGSLLKEVREMIPERKVLCSFSFWSKISSHVETVENSQAKSSLNHASPGLLG